MAFGSPADRDLLTSVRTLSKEADEPGWAERDYIEWNARDLLIEIRRLQAFLWNRSEPLHSANEPERPADAIQGAEQPEEAFGALESALSRPAELNQWRHTTEQVSLEQRQNALGDNEIYAHDPFWDGIEEELAAFVPPPDIEPQIRGWWHGERLVQAEAVQERYVAEQRERRAKAPLHQAKLALPTLPTDIWPAEVWGWDDPSMAEAGQPHCGQPHALIGGDLHEP